MSKPNLGKTLIIANPRAQSGAGKKVAERLRRFLQLYLDDPASFDLVQTEHPRHATEIARGAGSYDTVLALGGDGIIHEVVCGLMRLGAASRPALGIVPVGSGNDYAQTLGISDYSGRDFARLLSVDPVRMDIGKIAIDGEGAGARTEYFCETCSVGLDAAIAIDTYTLRQKTHLTGNALYMASGLRVFGPRFGTFPLSVSFDGEAPIEIACHFFAMQMGPTYGSGFQICPDADPQDGIIDVCYAAGPVPRAVALPIFLRAKNGKHVTSRHVHMRTARRIELSLARDGFPIQADGEQIHARRLSIDVLPHALTVLRPRLKA